MSTDLACLELIISLLRIHISTICTFPVYDSESIRLDVQMYGATVGDYIKSDSLTKEESEAIGTINKLTKVLYYMVKERLHLQQCSIDRLDDESNSNDDINSRAHSEDAIENEILVMTNPRRTQRLDKCQIDELENWFKTNNNFPFLTSLSTQTLSTKTSLTIKQVRNWYVFLEGFSHGTLLTLSQGC